MTHLWVRAEERPNEERTGILPDGVATLIDAGMQVTVEASDARVIMIEGYAEAGAAIAAPGSWREAPGDAIIFGLKELREEDTPLQHRHIMFGHAYKGQPAGQALLRRFQSGGGTLYDLEYLTDDAGRRLAAFGYWAGYAGAAVAVMSWIAQQHGGQCGALEVFYSQTDLTDALETALSPIQGGRPDALIVGAKGRVGSGAEALCGRLGMKTTLWDMEETAGGGPFPDIQQHRLFLNCVLAGPQTPVFVPESTLWEGRRLRVIGDISCDPSSDFNPIKVYDQVTSWERPARRVHHNPPLDVVAIDNLPSLLPVESSVDFAGQLLPVLKQLDEIDTGPWGKAKVKFDFEVAQLTDQIA